LPNQQSVIISGHISKFLTEYPPGSEMVGLGVFDPLPVTLIWAQEI